jgi:hypothetical protein
MPLRIIFLEVIKMTEEQRFNMTTQLHKDEIQLLKRIAEALETIAAGYKMSKLKVLTANTDSPEDLVKVLTKEDL